MVQVTLHCKNTKCIVYIKSLVYAYLTVPFFQPFESGPVILSADTAAAAAMDNAAAEKSILERRVGGGDIVGGKRTRDQA